MTHPDRTLGQHRTVQVPVSLRECGGPITAASGFGQCETFKRLEVVAAVESAGVGIESAGCEALARFG